MPRPSSNIHGNSQWSSSNSSLDAVYRTIQGESTIPLTVQSPGSRTGLLWDTTVEQGHGLCFAPNRVGKGASVIINTLLSYGGSIIGVDPKGENCFVTAARRRSLGHRTVNLDPMGEVNRAYGDGKIVERVTKFNPMRMLDASASTFADDVMELAHANIITAPDAKDPFFDNAARDMTAGAIAISKEIFGDEANLIGVRKLLTDAEAMAATCEEALRVKPDSIGLEKLRAFIKITPREDGEGFQVDAKDDRTTENIRQTAATQTSYLDSAAMRESLADDDPKGFTMDWLQDGRTTVYLVLPPKNLETHARWLRLCLSLALRSITTAPQSKRPKIPTLFLIDEMGTIGPLRALDTAFGQLAGYGVRLFGFYQTLSQLKGDYRSTWNNFVGNCSYIQCLGARDPETAKFISDLLGYQTWVSDDGDRKDRRPLMLPQEIMEEIGKYPDKLNQNRQIVVAMQGQRRYLEYQNPYFMQSSWNMKYRQFPGAASWPIPASVVFPERAYSEKERREAQTRIQKKMQAGGVSVGRADFVIMDSDILMGGPNVKGYYETLARHDHIFGGSAPAQEATSQPGPQGWPGDGGMGTAPPTAGAGLGGPKLSALVDKRLLVAGVIALLLRLFLNSMGAQHFRITNPEYMVYALLGLAWPLCLLSMIAVAAVRLEKLSPPRTATVKAGPGSWILRAAILVFVLSWLLDAIGAARFSPLNPLAMLLSFCGAVWPWLSLAAIAVLIWRFYKRLHP